MDNRCKLFVGGLALYTSTSSLGQFFQQWGNVVDANVMVNPNTMQSRGFGFVTYDNPSMVDVAMKNRPHSIDGRRVETKRPMPRDLASSGNNMSCNKLLVRASSVDANSALNQQGVCTYFQNFGNVLNVTSPSDPAGNFVVEFDDYDPVDKAILHGAHQLNGMTLKISKDTSSRVPQPGGGGGIKDGRVDCKVFVGGLDHATTDTSLSEYFEQYGKVASAHVMIDAPSGRSRGFGFVTFADGASVDKALSQKAHYIDGRSVDPKRFESRESLKSGSSVVVKNGNNTINMCKLFVGGLSPDTNDDGLSSYLGQYGEIVDGHIMRDQNTKRSRCFAFITFGSPEAVDAVMGARPHLLDDKEVEMKRPMPKELASPENTITVKKLFAGAVKDGTTDEQMREHFATFGNIVDLCLPMDRDSCRLRGFAFIEYDDYDAVDKAIVVGHHQVNGKVLDVKKALSKEEMARVSAARQSKANQGDVAGYYGQHHYGYGDHQTNMGGYGVPYGAYGYPPQANPGYGPPPVNTEYAGYGAGYGAAQGQGAYGAAAGAYGAAAGGYGAAAGGYGAAAGGYGAAAGGYGATAGGYGAAAGGYGAAAGGYEAAAGGYGAAASGYGAAQGQGEYGATQSQGEHGSAQGQGGYGATQSHCEHGASQGQGGYGAAQGQGEYGAAQGQGGYGAAEGQGGYGAAEGQGGYGAAQGQWGSGDGVSRGYAAGKGTGGGPIRTGQSSRPSPYSTNQRGGGPQPSGKPPVPTGPPPQQSAPNNAGYARY